MTRPPDATGPHGSAWRINAQPRDTDQTACLAQWLVHVPDAHPFWPYYAVSVVHLRPIPGVREAHLDYPDAEYELMVIACDPTYHPSIEKADAGELHWLTPLNVREQFHGLTDAQAAQIAEGAAKAIITGLLPAEPDDSPGAREAWHDTIQATVEHHHDPTHGGTVE